MASYQTAKEKIKRAADIVEVVGGFVQLKKAGMNHVGLCPFHAEKDPSFTVNRERQTFHCFGCKKGGDVFSFWMEYHSCSFPEALRDLADKYDIVITEAFSQAGEKQRSEERKRLYQINEKATTYFQKLLRHPVQGKKAHAYLKHRMLSDEIISEFRLGYAPSAWDGLVNTLTKEGLNLNDAVQAGLLIAKKSGGYYDRFRNRIIFPIFDLRDQVVGFGGRVLDDSLPKYLNTPETSLFHKGEALYGLSEAHKYIRESGRVVIVEGYMDCLALRKHGLKEVVATLGTALTEKHVRRLRGYAKEAVVVFDADNAGMRAALRSVPLFSNEGLPAKAVVLPEGYDPDIFINEKGPESFLAMVDSAAPLFELHLNNRSPRTDEEKVRLLREVIPVLSEIRDFALRSLYIRRLSENLDIKEDVVLEEVSAFIKNGSGGLPCHENGQTIEGTKVRKTIRDRQFLSLILHYPQSLARISECDCKVLLSDPAIIEVIDKILEMNEENEGFSPEKLLETLDSEAACQHVRELMLQKPPYCEEEVELAVSEFENRIAQIRLSASFKEAEGNARVQNQLLKMKTERDLRSQKTWHSRGEQ
jgi:DNA primase